ncbi:hypothetical protein Tco_1518992, partial [Tanacetum coccineum]
SDSPDKDLTETAELLHTQTSLTPVVQLPPTRPLPTSSAIIFRPRKEILLPPSAASPSSPPLSLLPSSSRKRSKSPSPPPPPAIPLPPLAIPPPPTAVPLPPPLEHIESVEDDVETMRARLASAEQEIATLRARVETFEQHDEVTRDSLRISKGGITQLQLRAVYAKQQVTDLHDSQVTDRLEITKLHSTRLERSHVRQTGDIVCIQRADMTEKDVEALHARAERQQVEALQISFGFAQMDITDLLESRRVNRLEMAELRSRA